MFVAALCGTGLSTFAEIVIKPVRTPSVSTNRPGIIVPGPDGGGITHEQPPQVIELLDGDVLKGTFVGFDSESGAKWRHSAVKTDIEFMTDSLSKISLFPRPYSGAPSDNTRVELVTGEELSGELLEMNNRNLILKAWYSRSTLRIPREKILAIRPATAEAGVIYEGPTGMEGWKSPSVGVVRNRQIPQPNILPAGRLLNRPDINFRPGKAVPMPGGATQGWKYDNEAFVATRSSSLIGREMKLTDKVNVEFDLNWRGNFNMGISVFADKFDAYSGNSYMVGFSPNDCYLMRMANNVQNNLGRASFQDLRSKTKARISVRINKEDGTIALVLNNRVVKEWEDNAGFAGKGGNVSFVLLQNTYVKVSNIRVSQWDGKLPSGEGPKKEGKDLLVMSSAGSLSGELLGILDGKVRFKAAFSPEPLEMTLDTVARINLADTKLEKPKLGLGDVRVTFSNGGQFTFLLENWGADRVTGLSTVLGRVEFQPGAFSLLEFNLTKKEGSGSADPFDDF
jgi:hypothetical protein